MHYRDRSWTWNGESWVNPKYDGPGHWYTAAEVALALAVTAETVRAWVKRGRLKAERTPGGRLIFAARDVERWLGKQASV